MSDTVVTTAQSTRYGVRDGTMYIAPSGSLLQTAEGWENVKAVDGTYQDVTVLVDGSLTSLHYRAISLATTDVTALKYSTVSIGTTGTVRGGEDAVHMDGSGNTFQNAGSVWAADTGIAMVGNVTEAQNSGVITARVGMFTEGSFAKLFNSGSINAIIGMGTNGDSSEVTNTGQINSAFTGNTTAPGAVEMLNFAQSTFTNLGSVTAGSANGLYVRTFSTGGALTVTNDGSIVSTAADGFNLTGNLGEQDSMAFVLANSGLISGRMDGIDSQMAVNIVTNDAGGTIKGLMGSGITTGWFLRLHNSGVIEAGNNLAAIRLGAHSGGSVIVNLGLIAADSQAIDATALITNGGVTLRNFGTISGDYLGAMSDDRIINHGRMDDLSTNGDADLVRNLGTITGTLALGGGNDTYIGKGTVLGYVDGGGGNDKLTGGADDDDLRGGTGNDLMLGGGGDDSLLGGTGKDVMTGGTGADLFVFGGVNDTPVGVTCDVITDFTTRSDHIDLSAFMAGGRYIGAGTFGASGTGEVRYSSATGLISGDTDGNGTTDWQVQLASNTALVAADFLF